MFSRWHGPAITLGRAVGLQEAQGQSYWVAHAHSLLLVAQKHLRSATREEALADRVMNRLLGEVQATLQRDRHQLRFHDLRNQANPPAPRRENEAPPPTLETGLTPLIQAMHPEAPAEAERAVDSTGEPDAEADAPSPAQSGERGGAGEAPAAEEAPESEDPAEIPVPDDDNMVTLELRNKTFVQGRKRQRI